MASKIKLKNANGNTLEVKNNDAVLEDLNVSYFNTVEELTTAVGSDGDLAIVADLDRGGNFKYDSAATDNGGTVFGKWVRQYDGAINVKWFGSVNASNLVTALEAVPISVHINEVTTLDPTLSEATTIMANLDRIHFNETTTLNLPQGEMLFTSRIELTNPTFMNVIIAGEDTPSTSLISIGNITGSPKGYSVDYTVADASSIEIGEYILCTVVTGTGACDAFRGCFKVTGKSGNVVTITHPSYKAIPSYTITGGTVYPLKTIMRWSANTLGFCIAGANLRTLRNVVLAGAFNPATDTPSDTPADGLQIGTASNTPETGLNESERQPDGSGWFARIGIVEWEANGVQCISGNAYMVSASACSNGWRGFQVAGSGSLSVKSSSAVGNGASNYESEGNGFLNANNSYSIGGNAQGYYAIGGTSLSAGSSKAIANYTYGYESKNNSTVNIDGAVATDNTLFGINCLGASVLVGASAQIDGVNIAEGGKVNATGATTLGTVTVDYDSGSIYIAPNGDKLPVERWDSFPSQPVFEGVTVTTNNSTGKYCQIGNIVFWKIHMDYSGLDTTDLSTFVINGVPISMAGRVGSCDLNIRSSTGLTFSATDTYQADYNTVNDKIVLVDNAGNLPKYNSGKIAASGVIDISGWYEV